MYAVDDVIYKARKVRQEQDQDQESMELPIMVELPLPLVFRSNKKTRERYDTIPHEQNNYN